MLTFVWDGNQWPLPDADTFARTFDLGSNPSEVIDQIEVSIGITHDRLADLSVALVGPDASRIVLASTGQLSGTQIQARFNDDAVAPISTGTAPYQGRFAPAGELNAFRGLQFNGTWTIEVTDHAAGVTGTLNHWAIYVNEPPPELSFRQASLRDETGVEVPAFIPGDVVGVQASWNAQDVYAFGQGRPYTLRVAVDGVALDKELLGTAGTMTVADVLRGWQPSLGTHTVEITLDPENRVWELDETDNTHTFEFEVLDIPRASRLVTVTPESARDYPHGLVPMGDALYFLVSPVGTLFGAELWRTDGTQEGTTLVFDGPSSGDSPAIFKPVVVGDQLFFVVDHDSHGSVLYVSDGTPEGTRRVDPGSFNSQPRDLTSFRGELYFTRSNGSGRSLWKTDGTQAGTTALQFQTWDAGQLTPVGDTLYYVADQGGTGPELWRTDGTREGTEIVADLVPGTGGSSPSRLTRIGDRLFFLAYSEELGRELWATDGNLVWLVSDMRPGINGSEFEEAVDLNGAAIFRGYDRELWRSDGTDSGTGILVDLDPQSSSFPSQLKTVGDTTFFTARDTSHGGEVWATDGAADSTHLVADLQPGTESSRPIEFVEMRGNLVFMADVGSYHFFASDGTSEGTGLAAMLPRIRGDYTDESTSEVTVVGDRLYFFWSDAETGRNLWSVELQELPSQRPDLRVAGSSLFEAPRQFGWGDDVQLNVAVANGGSNASPSPESIAAVYLSADPWISTSDVLLSGTSGGRLLVPPVGGDDARLNARGDDLRLPAVAPDGLPEAGVFYIGVVIDPDDAMDELNEANNANQGLLVDVIPIRIGPPQLVHVVTHGFRPPGFSEADFLQPWQDEYPGILRELSQKSHLAYLTETWSPTWDSTSGFLRAWADEILYELFTSISNVPETSLLAAIARWMIVGEEDVSYRNAVDAAHDIFKTIQETPHLQGSEFHLIGHSRGAAVNALLSKLLTDEGYHVAQYTSLDGYSTDWPFPSGLLGDVPIAKNPTSVVAERKVNYQVEKGIDAFLKMAILDRLGIQSPTEEQEAELRELEDLLSKAEFKAPRRDKAGFEDKLIRGSAADPSDHFDVHGLYFRSEGNAPTLRYVLDSPLGRPPGRSWQGGPQGGTLDDSGNSERSLHGLIDGSFEQAGLAWQQAVQLASSPSSDNVLLTAWLDVLQDPLAILQSRWAVDGAVVLTQDRDNWMVEMSEAANTRMSQTVHLLPAVAALTFDLEITQPRSGASLEVTFDDQVLHAVDLTAASGVQTIVVPLEAIAGNVGSIGLRVQGDSATAAVVRVDNLDLETPGTIDTLLVTPWSAAPTEPLTLEVASNELAADQTDEVAFYLESNGVAGLQLGGDGDRLLGADRAGDDGWSIVVPAGSLLPGNHAAYAVGVKSGTVAGLPGMAGFSIRFGERGWQNPVDRLDVNADNLLSPADVLSVINNINQQGARALPRPSYLTTAPPNFIDPTGDNNITAADALVVINALNSRAAAEGEAIVLVQTPDATRRLAVLAPPGEQSGHAEPVIMPAQRDVGPPGVGRFPAREPHQGSAARRDPFWPAGNLGVDSLGIGQAQRLSRPQANVESWLRPLDDVLSSLPAETLLAWLSDGGSRP